TRLLPASTGGSLRWLTGPLTGWWSMRERSPWYRNDEGLDDLADLFTARNGTDFFRTAFVECRGDAPLSWYLPSFQTEDIIAQAANGVGELLGQLWPWLRQPGVPPRKPADAHRPEEHS